MRISESLRHQV